MRWTSWAQVPEGLYFHSVVEYTAHSFLSNAISVGGSFSLSWNVGSPEWVRHWNPLQFKNSSSGFAPCCYVYRCLAWQTHKFIFLYIYKSHRKSFELNQASPCLLEAVNRHVAPPNTEEESPIKTVVGATGSEGITISILLNIMYIDRYSCLTGPSLYVAGKKKCVFMLYWLL